MTQRCEIRWFGLLLFALLWATGVGTVSADKSEKKQPWFLTGKEASRARARPQSGPLLELRILPQVKLATGHIQPLVSLEWGREQLSLLGHADLRWTQPWLSLAQGNLQSFVFGDGGSRMALRYRWQSAQHGRFHREVGFFWYPFDSAPFRMGEVLETLWSFRELRRPPAFFPARMGMKFAWEWFQLESLIAIHWWRKVEKNDVEILPSPVLLNRLRFRPHRMFSFGVDGGFFFDGEHADTNVRGEPYLGWGVHPVIQFRIGDRPVPIVFLGRRRRDPRAQQTSLTPLRTGKGLSLTAEFGVKGHHLQDPTMPTALRWELAYAFTARARGQWGILSAELLFHWHNFAWTVFDRPGLVFFQGLEPNANVHALFLVGAAIGVLVHRTVSLGARLELLLPSAHRGPLPSAWVGNNPQPGAADLVAVFYAPEQMTFLPLGTDVIVETKVMANMRWEPWSFFSVMVEAWFSINPNDSAIDSSSGATKRIVKTSHQFGSELLLQVRFR